MNSLLHVALIPTSFQKQKTDAVHQTPFRSVSISGYQALFCIYLQKAVFLSVLVVTASYLVRHITDYPTPSCSRGKYHTLCTPHNRVASNVSAYPVLRQKPTLSLEEVAAEGNSSAAFAFACHFLPVANPNVAYTVNWLTAGGSELSSEMIDGSSLMDISYLNFAELTGDSIRGGVSAFSTQKKLSHRIT